MNAEKLLLRKPFGSCTNDEWFAIAKHLLRSLSEFLKIQMELVGDRQPDGDNFAPLIRSVEACHPTLGLQVAGILSCCTTAPNSGLKVDTLLFLFSWGQRVSPPHRLFFTCDYLGPGNVPEWVWKGWQASDFEEQWDPYSHQLFFGGLPG